MQIVKYKGSVIKCSDKAQTLRAFTSECLTVFYSPFLLGKMDAVTHLQKVQQCLPVASFWYVCFLTKEVTALGS